MHKEKNHNFNFISLKNRKIKLPYKLTMNYNFINDNI